MTKADKLLAYVSTLIKEHAEENELSGTEELGFKTSVYHIFQSSNDLEKIYYEILDFFDEEKLLTPLIPRVEMFFATSI